MVKKVLKTLLKIILNKKNEFFVLIYRIKKNGFSILIYKIKNNIIHYEKYERL